MRTQTVRSPIPSTFSSAQSPRRTRSPRGSEHTHGRCPRLRPRATSNSPRPSHAAGTPPSPFPKPPVPLPPACKAGFSHSHVLISHPLARSFQNGDFYTTRFHLLPIFFLFGNSCSFLKEAFCIYTGLKEQVFPAFQTFLHDMQ